MVGSGEGPLTQVTLEGPVAGVFAEVTRELVGAGELPSTAFPAAVVGLLTGVSAQMCLQVGTLGVRLAAACERAGVSGRAFPGPRAAPSLGLGLLQQLQG